VIFLNEKRTTVLQIILFLLGFAAIASGLAFIRSTMTMGEQAVSAASDFDQLTVFLRASAWKLVLSGILISAGTALALFSVFYIARKATRLQREAEAIRQKSEALETLKRQSEQLEHHQRLHIIGTLTSSIAHEFNNLLTPIMGYSMLALEKIPPEDEKLYDDILEIYNTSCKAKTIISRLSALSRKNTENSFRQISPDDLIRRTLEVAAPAKPEGVEVRLNLNCQEQRIEANEIQISQLLLNLILNGFDAIGDQNGILQIDTSFDETGIRITVTDSGCGIPAESLSKIFEPFFTTKEAGKGTGLGLAIAAQTVEDHHGKIEVKSRPAEGTAFTVNLPRTVDHHQKI